MKATTAATTTAWLSGDYTGPQRAMARATIQKLKVSLVSYELAADQILEEAIASKRGKFASAPFGQLHRPKELPNLASVKWDRNVDQPVAGCTMTFFNCEPLPLGTAPAGPYEFDQPGYYTYNRGVDGFSNGWGYVDNGWRGLLAPDRIIRTYEGYGSDFSVPPEADPTMTPSGVWMIDEVHYTADGMIQVVCRDLGRMLVDHIAFPPVVPWAEYPLTWEAFRTVANPPAWADVGVWKRPKWTTDSNQAYIGTDFTDGGRPYVETGGSVKGHHGRDAFDASTESYFLSVGNKATWSSAFEYVQGNVSNADISAVRVRVHGGPYRGYVSVKIAGEWKGTRDIPYVARVIDTNADIPFVKAFSIKKGDSLVVKLPKQYQNVDEVRVTLTNLWNSGIGEEFPYRAAIRDVQVNAEVSVSVDSGTHVEGNYGDYTDIVKWFCAWGGLYWPSATSGLAFVKLSNGTIVPLAPSLNDPIFPSNPGGRVWGDFAETGTAGVNVTLGVELFDKKPLIDCINYVRDIVNFMFIIGEDGGVIWRQPNIWSVGNYIWDPLGAAPVRTSTVVEIHEDQTLIDLTVKLSSRNIRESVFVGNVAGNFGAISRGFRPSGTERSGLRRVGGWTDQRFESEDECRRMADLITLQQMFTYRENTCTIAANPALQVDDQVRLLERVTNESFLHYVKGITSNWDLRSGKWTYQLTTNWLGESFPDRWAFDPAQLARETQRYLYNMGLVSAVTGVSTYETDLLPADASEVGRIIIGLAQDNDQPLSFHVKKVLTNHPARVKLFQTLPNQTAGTPSIVNDVLDLPSLAVQHDPDVAGTCGVQRVPITVTNRGGVPRKIKVTVKWRVP